LDQEELNVEISFEVFLEHHLIFVQLQIDKQKHDSNSNKRIINTNNLFILLEENHENLIHNNQYENILVQNVVYLHPLYVHKVEIDLTE